MNAEMMRALEADGDKLRQLTGEDHGPWDHALSSAEMAQRMTIWDALAEKLGRQPTNKEASDEVKRILRGHDQPLRQPRRGPEDR